jgi:hypothetical protein
MAESLDRMKQGERETIITEDCAITVERTARGSFAAVTDAGSPFDGQYSFASVPSVALSLLLAKLAAPTAA